jgi:hypothetical protein
MIGQLAGVWCAGQLAVEAETICGLVVSVQAILRLHSPGHLGSFDKDEMV